MNVERLLVDPMGWADDGTVMMAHVLTESGINKKVV